MSEEKKLNEKELDEDALEAVSGGGVREWVSDAWDMINGRSGSGTDKEQQP